MISLLTFLVQKVKLRLNGFLLVSEKKEKNISRISSWELKVSFNNSSFLAPRSDVEVESCNLPPKPGPCKAAIPRYYFNPRTYNCERFTYGGCRGNANNFKTLEECKASCLREYFCIIHIWIVFTWHRGGQSGIQNNEIAAVLLLGCRKNQAGIELFSRFKFFFHLKNLHSCLPR